MCHSSNSYLILNLFLQSMTYKQYANSADPNHTAPKEQSDQGLRCFALLLLPNFFEFCGTHKLGVIGQPADLVKHNIPVVLAYTVAETTLTAPDNHDITLIKFQRGLLNFIGN